MKSSIKKLSKGPVGKKESKKGNMLQSVPSNQSGGIKRVKQKALASIVAKKLQQSNIHNNLQNTQKLSNLRIQSKNKKNVSTSETNKLDNIPFASDTQNTDTNKVVTEIVEKEKNVIKEPIISFVKPSKKLLGKAIVVKKRNINKTSSKKYLSEIFSNQVATNNVESALSDVTLNIKTDDKDTIRALHEQTTIEQPSKKLVLIKQLKKLDINTNNRKKKHLESITEHKVQKNESSDKTYKTYKKQTGKTSSLFRNNPEVPNIGQRFVKPIHEIVFTKTNFSDLDVHPFMVSSNVNRMKFLILL